MMKCTEDHFIMNESWNTGTSIVRIGEHFSLSVISKLLISIVFWHLLVYNSCVLFFCFDMSLH